LPKPRLGREALALRHPLRGSGARYLTSRRLFRRLSSMSNQNSKATRASLAAELVERLRQAADAAEALVQGQLRPYGLSVSQGRLFGLVADLSLSGQAPFQKDLEADMQLVTSSITNLLQGLERLGLIARIASRRDGRAKELHITAQGWEVYRKLGQCLPEWHAILTKSLSDQEIIDAIHLLQKLTGTASTPLIQFDIEP